MGEVYVIGLAKETKMKNAKLHPDTLAIHAGHRPADHQGAVKPPIHATSTFVFPTAEEGAAHMEAAYGVEGAVAPDSGYIYSRLGNPTRTAAEERLAALDGADVSAFFSSGMAAISTALLAWSGPDRAVWYAPPLYGGTTHFLNEVLPVKGTPVEVLDVAPGGADLVSALEAKRLATGTLPGIIFLETPANPTMQVVRISTAADWARMHSTPEHRILVFVDNTYLGPLMQRPLEVGADLVLYSATKYIGGHSDLIAGAASGAADIMEAVVGFRHFLGGMADPWTSWLLARSMETLPIRFERQQSTAKSILDFLRAHPAVGTVRSAHAEDLSPDAALAMAEQSSGAGSMLAFEVDGGREAAFKVLNAFNVFSLAVSLGSTESLAEHPASMTHAGVPADQKIQYGITEGLIRLSIGLEHPGDLIADLDAALAVLRSTSSPYFSSSKGHEETGILV
jgi:methionine-gamma-lyase